MTKTILCTILKLRITVKLVFVFHLRLALVIEDYKLELVESGKCVHVDQHICPWGVDSVVLYNAAQDVGLVQ